MNDNRDASIVFTQELYVKTEGAAHISTPPSEDRLGHLGDRVTALNVASSD